jgi:hypothetical protein
LLFIAMLFAGAIIAAAALPHSRQNPASPTDQPEGKKTDAGQELRRREHGKLFDGHHGPKLRDLAASQQGEVSVWEEEPYVIRRADDPVSQRPFMQFAVCNANAVVIGTLTGETPQLPPSENFIFTDYEMTVEEAIKPDASAVPRLDKILVTRQGGTLHQGGRAFRAEVEGFKPFAVGKRYLLFLRYIPTTGAYLAYANGSFQLDGNKVIALGKPPKDQSESLTTFLAEAHAAMAHGGCAK